MSATADTARPPPPVATMQSETFTVVDLSDSDKAINAALNSPSSCTTSTSRDECNTTRQPSDCTVDIEKAVSDPPPLPTVTATDAATVPDVVPDKRNRSKRAFSLPALSPHRRLMAVVAVVNLAILAIAIAKRYFVDNPPALGYIIIANIFVAIITRQQRVVNLLFKLATAPGTRLPLPVRWALAKIYHFGGLHSGCSVAATVWLLLFTGAITRLRVLADLNGNDVVDASVTPSISLLMLTYAIDVLLIAIVVLALPVLRSRFHNSFEISHRFMGWSVLALVWAHTVILIRDYRPTGSSVAVAFFTSVTPYLLAVITLSVASPWLTMRMVAVSIEKPSDHAIIATFPEGVRPTFAGSSSNISLSPWVEWHSFANIPTPNHGGFRLVISRAGDWTSSVIDNPPSHFWVRGIPTAGVANVETLFRRVLYVATGSGIGPVMPHLLGHHVPAALFWSARTPRVTYGDAFVDEIVDACPDAVIFDTKARGKPDMVAWTCQRVRETGAEAVICISNQKLTRKVVYGMEARGIPAFGAIWDS